MVAVTASAQQRIFAIAAIELKVSLIETRN